MASGRLIQYGEPITLELPPDIKNKDRPAGSKIWGGRRRLQRYYMMMAAMLQAEDQARLAGLLQAERDGCPYIETFTGWEALDAACVAWNAASELPNKPLTPLIRNRCRGRLPDAAEIYLYNCWRGTLEPTEKGASLEPFLTRERVGDEVVETVVPLEVVRSEITQTRLRVYEHSKARVEYVLRLIDRDVPSRRRSV